MDAKERLEQINSQIKKLEEEKEKILKEIYGSRSKILDQMPIRVYNALIRNGILTDIQVKTFFDGEIKEGEIPHINYHRYKEVATRQERLMLLRNIGEKCASEAVRMAEENGM